MAMNKVNGEMGPGPEPRGREGTRRDRLTSQPSKPWDPIRLVIIEVLYSQEVDERR